MPERVNTASTNTRLKERWNTASLRQQDAFHSVQHVTDAIESHVDMIIKSGSTETKCSKRNHYAFDGKYYVSLLDLLDAIVGATLIMHLSVFPRPRSELLSS